MEGHMRRVRTFTELERVATNARAATASTDKEIFSTFDMVLPPFYCYFPSNDANKLQNASCKE